MSDAHKKYGDGAYLPWAPWVLKYEEDRILRIDSNNEIESILDTSEMKD